MSRCKGLGTRLEYLERRCLRSAVPVGPEFRVNAYTNLEQSSRSVAMDASGDFVVVWQSYGQDAEFTYGVYAQRYSAAGDPVGGEFRVNAQTTGQQVHPVGAVDDDGAFVVVWDGAGTGDSSGVFARRYDPAGNPLGDQFRVNTFSTGLQRFPTVASDDDGDLVIAWTSSNQDGSHYGIYAQRYDAAGNKLGEEFRANAYTTGTQLDAQAAAAADGAFVIVWTSGEQDGFGGGIYARRFDAAGVPQGEEFRVNATTTGDQEQPAVAADGGGNFVVAWHSDHDPGNSDVYARRYNAAGAPLGDEFRVNTYTTSSQASPSVAIDGDRDFLIAWDSDGQDGSGIGIYAQGFGADGVAQGDEFRVNTHTPARQAFPTVATDDDGDAVIVWESLYQDGSRFGVYAQRYEVAADVTASAFLFDTAPHRLHFTFDRDVGAVLGTDDLLVENLTTGLTIPSSSFSLTYDPPTRVATFTYTGAAGGTSGVLPDGRYRATILAAGTTLAVNHVFEFRFLRGDANGDGRVNLNDFNILAANFGQSPRDFTQGDFDYSGNVNLSDFNILAGRFGTALVPATSAPGTSRDDASLDEDTLNELR